MTEQIIAQPDRDASRTDLPRCWRCGAEMTDGMALESTFTGSPDFIGGEVVTLSPGGPGKLVACMKCIGCGYSTT